MCVCLLLASCSLTCLMHAPPALPMAARRSPVLPCTAWYCACDCMDSCTWRPTHGSLHAPMHACPVLHGVHACMIACIAHRHASVLHAGSICAACMLACHAGPPLATPPTHDTPCSMRRGYRALRCGYHDTHSIVLQHLYCLHVSHSQGTLHALMCALDL